MDEDQQWLKTSELDNSEYRIEVQNRTKQKRRRPSTTLQKTIQPN